MNAKKTSSIFYGTGLSKDDQVRILGLNLNNIKTALAHRSAILYKNLAREAEHDNRGYFKAIGS